MTGRNSGVRASSLLGLSPSSVASLGFDLACAETLLRFEDKREMARMKALKIIIRNALSRAITIAFGGKVEDDPDDAEPLELNEDDIL